MDALEIANALADGKKQLALDLMGKFLQGQNIGDEKSSIIQLNALLAEQFRNVCIIQNFLERGVKEEEILEKTGWKPGRLFIVKKIAKKFNFKKVVDFLAKLEALDTELKTSATPPKVLLDLVVAQLL